MASQEDRLREWRRASGENDKAKESHERSKRKREGRPAKKRPPKSVFDERLVTAAEKSAVQHDTWLKEGAGYVEAEEGEQTFQFQQQDIVKNVPIGAAQKAFDLSLPELGPYRLDYSPNGRHLLIGGRKGHLAEFDWQTGKLLTEIQVYETVRDVQFLHNHLYWAAAQKKYVYIYNSDGVELHRLKSLHEPHCLEFLPHHFLLCSTGNVGVLSWQDTTSGQLIASHATKKGCCRVMRQNPWNGVLCLGHSFGTVSMWTPNLNTPVAQLKSHKTAISALAIDPSGRYLVTGGMERIVKVWDVRKFEELHCYFTSRTPDAIAISQTGLMAVSYGTRTEVWKEALAEKQAKPYLVHRCTGHRIHDVRFCPYEDVLGIGHAAGLCHMLVPGSGEANYDSFVADPYQTQKGRRESEIAQLMDKLPPDLITLNPEDIRNIRTERRDEADTALSDDSGSEKDVSKKKQEKKTKIRRKQRQAPEEVPFTLRRFYS